jgi:hypothetical protein
MFLAHGSIGESDSAAIDAFYYLIQWVAPIIVLVVWGIWRKDRPGDHAGASDFRRQAGAAAICAVGILGGGLLAYLLFATGAVRQVLVTEFVLLACLLLAGTAAGAIIGKPRPWLSASAAVVLAASASMNVVAFGAVESAEARYAVLAGVLLIGCLGPTTTARAVARLAGLTICVALIEASGQAFAWSGRWWFNQGAILTSMAVVLLLSRSRPVAVAAGVARSLPGRSRLGI